MSICFIKFRLILFTESLIAATFQGLSLKDRSIFAFLSLVHGALLGCHLVHWQVSHTNWQSLEKQASCCVYRAEHLWPMHKGVNCPSRTNKYIDVFLLSDQLVGALRILSLSFFSANLINIWFIEPSTKVISQHGHAFFSFYIVHRSNFNGHDHFSIIWLPNDACWR